MMLRRLLPLLLVLLPFGAESASIKKWVDENGQVHYGTSIPPQYVEGAHTELNNRGIAVKRTERAKTREEIAQEQELQRLRKEARLQAEQQRARDRVLLSMYRTEEDLVLIRDGKIAQIDSQIKLKQKQIERLKIRLAKWQASAAAAERRGGKLNPKQQENLDSTKRQIEAAYASILDKQSDRKRIEAHYAHDLARFRKLRGGDSAEPESPPPANNVAVDIEGSIICSSVEECDRLWPKAQAYVRAHANTPVEVSGNRILMTKTPDSPQQISLTASRISKGGVERLFLDVQCHNSLSGREHCQTDAVKKVRQNFAHAIQGQ